MREDCDNTNMRRLEDRSLGRCFVQFYSIMMLCRQYSLFIITDIFTSYLCCICKIYQCIIYNLQLYSRFLCDLFCMVSLFVYICNRIKKHEYMITSIINITSIIILSLRLRKGVAYGRCFAFCY